MTLGLRAHRGFLAESPLDWLYRTNLLHEFARLFHEVIATYRRDLHPIGVNTPRIQRAKEMIA
jgi:hypothetical protein